jgi:Fe-S cluster assembly iron-binding protein IscA
MVPSERAVEKLKEELVTRFSNQGIGFRVCQDLDSSGNSRLALKLDRKSPGDEAISVQGIQIILDPVNSKQLSDMELDFIDGPTGGFILKDLGNCEDEQWTGY